MLYCALFSSQKLCSSMFGIIHVPLQSKLTQSHVRICESLLFIFIWRDLPYGVKLIFYSTLIYTYIIIYITKKQIKLNKSSNKSNIVNTRSLRDKKLRRHRTENLKRGTGRQYILGLSQTKMYKNRQKKKRGIKIGAA